MHYSMFGSCRYGSACKYDHPLMGYYNYAVPTLSVPDPSAFFPLSQRNLLQVTSASTTETSLKLPDQIKKSDETSNTETNAETVNNNEHVNDSSPTQATSPSMDTAPSSESAQNHSD